MATVIRGDDNFDTAFAKSVAIIADVKAYNVSGGTFTQDAWQTRDLNTELDDPENIVTIASNQFTLQAGTYLIEWTAPAYSCNRHSSRLWNNTASTVVVEGTTSFAADGIENISNGAAVEIITTASVFEIQHYAQTTSGTNGFGVNSNVVGINSVYTLVKIHKIGA